MSGIQDNTVLDGHVDRYLDGTIQWTFVSLMFSPWPVTKADAIIQVSQYGNVVWMSVAVWGHLLQADTTMNLGLTAYSWGRCVVQLGLLVVGHRPYIGPVRSCASQ